MPQGTPTCVYMLHINSRHSLNCTKFVCQNWYSWRTDWNVWYCVCPSQHATLPLLCDMDWLVPHSQWGVFSVFHCSAAITTSCSCTCVCQTEVFVLRSSVDGRWWRDLWGSEFGNVACGFVSTTVQSPSLCGIHLSTQHLQTNNPFVVLHVLTHGRCSIEVITSGLHRLICSVAELT